MIKKIFFSLLTFLSYCSCVSAQEIKTMQGKYCLTFTDFVNDQWNSIDSLSLKTRSKGQMILAGGGDYQFEVPSDKQLEKLLKKQVLVVCIDDTYYVNLRKLKHKGAKFGVGFTIAYKTTDNKLVFNEKYIAFGVPASPVGLIGGAIAEVRDEKLEDKVCYLIKSDEGKVVCIDKDILPDLLVNHNDLLKIYSQVEGTKNKRNAAIVFPLLVKAGIISKP
ncbi:MAG: hypothetical protein IKI18_03050 [Prevotella sp.]|nr:hypothetical protein [Prevotella sp.]